MGAGAENARAALDAALDRCNIALARREVAAGSPARVLHQVAEIARADLIVVGSSHRRAVGRLLAGDAAASTLHESPCAVAIAPRGAGMASTPLRSIGVGFDGSEESRGALRLAAAVALSRGASLRVLEVATMPMTMSAAPAFDETWFETYREEAEERVAAAVSEIRGVGAIADAVVGAPVLELTRLSQRVDLLVLGSRAGGRVHRVVVGSTAAALSHEAGCPLLVLPRGAAERSEPHPPSAEPTAEPV